MSHDDINAAFSAPHAALARVQDEIHGVLLQISTSALEDALDLLLDAPRVYVTGEGRSGYMAQAFAMRLMHLGLTAHFLGDTCTPAVAAGDLVVGVSGSGNSASTVRALATAEQVAATTLAVTSAPKSPLACGATMTLLIPAATKHRRPGEASTVQPLSGLFDQCTHLVLDAICLVIATRSGVHNDSAFRAHSNME